MVVEIGGRRNLRVVETQPSCLDQDLELGAFVGDSGRRVEASLLQRPERHVAAAGTLSDRVPLALPERGIGGQRGRRA